MKKRTYLFIIVAVCVAFLGGFLTGINKVSGNEEKVVKIENTAFMDVLETEEHEAEQPDIEKSKTELECEAIEREIAEEYGSFELYNTSDLSLEMLENRMEWSEKVIVEKTIGKVLDDDLNGEAEDFYINYSCVPGVKAGDEVISYFVYNPATNYCDDIIERYDVIVE